MSFLRQADVPLSLPRVAALRDNFGFVPNLLKAQAALPGVVEAEVALGEAILLRGQAHARRERLCIVLLVAALHRNQYCLSACHQMLQLLGVAEERLDEMITGYRYAGFSAAERALYDFSLKLAGDGSSLTLRDVSSLRAQGWTDESILDAVLTTAFANFVCTLSAGLGVAPDFAPKMLAPVALPPPDPGGEALQPYLPAPDLGDFAPFVFLRERFGAVPGVFHAQTLRPDAIEAETGLLAAVLEADHLTSEQKQALLPVRKRPDAHGAAAGPLLDFARRLAADPRPTGPEIIAELRRHGCGDEQILEAVVAGALANFLNTLQPGLGIGSEESPGSAPAPGPAKTLHLAAGESRPTRRVEAEDLDAECVARVRNGDVNAFEQLMNRHQRRVYRTLIAILGDAEEARDAMQDTFLRAFQHLDKFEHRSKFSTWLVSIASNTGIERLRARARLVSLDDDPGSEEGFRPRHVRAWEDDPERLYSKAETRALVERGVMRLPANYRVVVVLRDLEQLPVEEVAAALDLSIPALKARLLRGRLMLRESLAPHFARGAKGAVH